MQVRSSFLVSANSLFAFEFDFCCRATLDIQKMFKDGRRIGGLTYQSTEFRNYQRVAFENATVSDSGVYKFEIEVIAENRKYFVTFLFHAIDVKGRCLGKL